MLPEPSETFCGFIAYYMEKGVFVMNSTQMVATVVLTLILGLGSPTNVFANNNDERRENILDKAKNRINATVEVGKRAFTGLGVQLGNAKITAKSDTTLTVEKDGTSYTVNLDSKTQFRRRFWGKGDLSEFQVGDTVNVIGRWTDDTKVAINAVLIRDLSIQKRFGVFFGDVKSLVTNGWVMSTKSDKRADQTVTVSTSTKFVNGKNEAMTQADVKVGDRVRVKGLWDRALNTVTEVTEVKDFGVLPKVSVTVTPTP